MGDKRPNIFAMPLSPGYVSTITTQLNMQCLLGIVDASQDFEDPEEEARNLVD